MKSFILLLSLVFSPICFSATVAVIDSGLDINHQDIKSHVWTNEDEVFNQIDSDGNGYIDDIYGWNFAENNNKLIDYKYQGTFSDDVYLFFEVQARQLLGTLSEEDKEWLKEKRSDKNFIAEMGKFGNYVHGTHVTGIAIDKTNSHAMGIKLIPTEVKPFAEKLAKDSKAKTKKEGFRRKLLSWGMKFLGSQQMKLLTMISSYISVNQIDVANGSFGTGFAQASMIVRGLYKVVVGHEPSEEQLKKATAEFINILVKEGQKMMNAAPNTLFVFAAGNDGTNNDVLPASPANVKTQNSIAVAATYGTEMLAPFSNYGIKMVEVAAPGMLINSAIPGGEHLVVSGTSQAAPYVANIALRVKEINESLRPNEIKSIIMGTVDKKDFLKEKVKSGGVVNKERAIQAARNSITMSLQNSIELAKTQILSQQESFLPPVGFAFPIPLTPMFR